MLKENQPYQNSLKQYRISWLVSMKGVILAGGLGTRLYPCTKVINKHLLPVYNKPMIFYPLKTLKSIGVNNILIVTGGESIEDFMKLLGSGSEFGVKFTYKIQDRPGGIAEALLLGEDFFGNEKVICILGDNIFLKDIKIPKDILNKNNNEAAIFIKKHKNPERFGVALCDENGRVIHIVEKPKKPKSNLIVTGLYIYPPDVFEFIKTLKPSARGELEITDVNNFYIKEGRMRAFIVGGDWSDAGTIETLHEASILVRKRLNASK
ncbi:MAG: sugar phosphate nucleotidyltransferase [Candidatus Aenigmatarchaeota archaeon]